MIMPRLALLSGGKATRMRPLTDARPKALLEVAGEPFIAHQLRLLARQGIRHVVICTGHLGHMIEEFVGDGARFGVDVSYSRDGEAARGTGGAIRNALPLLGEEFLVMYGDSYLPCPLMPIVECFRGCEKLGLMTVYANEDRWDTSNVEYSDGMILRYDKLDRTPAMRYIDYGLGCFRAGAFTACDNVIFDLADLYRFLLERDQLGGYEVAERFYEIGSPKGLAETESYLRANP